MVKSSAGMSKTSTSTRDEIRDRRRAFRGEGNDGDEAGDTRKSREGTSSN